MSSPYRQDADLAHDDFMDAIDDALRALDKALSTAADQHKDEESRGDAVEGIREPHGAVTLVRKARGLLLDDYEARKAGAQSTQQGRAA